jgi:hypothetical protein
MSTLTASILIYILEITMQPPFNTPDEHGGYYPTTVIASRKFWDHVIRDMFFPSVVAWPLSAGSFREDTGEGACATTLNRRVVIPDH